MRSYWKYCWGMAFAVILIMTVDTVKASNYGVYYIPPPYPTNMYAPPSAYTQPVWNPSPRYGGGWYRRTTYVCRPITTYYKTWPGRNYPISSDFLPGRPHIWNGR